MDAKSKNLFLLSLLGSLTFLPVGSGSAQTFVDLYNFAAVSGPQLTNRGGAGTYGALILSGATLYGVASYGGFSGNGTVFAVSTNGTGFTNLHNFTAGVGNQNVNSDGIGPYGGLILSGDTLYGTTERGGKWGGGTVFALNTNGTGFRTLHDFMPIPNMNPITNSDGASPMGALVLAGDILYGTTSIGCPGGSGGVFACSTDGARFTNLYAFSATSYDPAIGFLNADGASPEAGLVLLSNRLYGATARGGSAANGTLFVVNTNGRAFTKLHDFSGFNNRFHTNSDGANPSGSLVLSGSTLYGMTRAGGTWGDGSVFQVHTDGSGFANLHNFSGLSQFGNELYVPSSDGDFPVGGLVLLTNTLYGAATEGGNTNSTSGFHSGYGTVFALNTDGTGFATLYRFSPVVGTNLSNGDGAFPYSGLVQAGGVLYGTTTTGGSSGYGTIFSLPVTLRASPPPLPQSAVYAEFTLPSIQTSNLTIVPGAYFTYNSLVGGSWGIAAPGFGFTGSFYVPATGNYWLTVEHQTSAATNCPGGGYSPVDISINGTLIASSFDPAQENGGNLGLVTNSWVIHAVAGPDNTLQWTADRLCSRYWIQGIQITPVLSPLLKWGTVNESIILFWENSWTGFILESSTNLGAAWDPVSPAPVLLGGLNVSTNTRAAPSRFFRLRYAPGP